MVEDVCNRSLHASWLPAERPTQPELAPFDQMAAAHNAAKAIKLETALSGMPVPLHPGAERYYREKGLVK